MNWLRCSFRCGRFVLATITTIENIVIPEVWTHRTLQIVANVVTDPVANTITWTSIIHRAIITTVHRTVWIRGTVSAIEDITVPEMCTHKTLKLVAIIVTNPTVSTITWTSIIHRAVITTVHRTVWRRSTVSVIEDIAVP